jgi:hypothetical protein
MSVLNLDVRLAVGRALLLLLPVILSGCISPKAYVDTALPVIRAEDVKSTAERRPVQLLVEFRTKGSPNARATEQIAPKVVEAVKKTNLFSEVSSTPVTDGRTLIITIDNVAITKDGVAKGVGVGLTFGLVGTMVTDGYICTATYTSPGGRSSVKSVNHALHTTVGNSPGPPGVQPMTHLEAIDRIMEQVTYNLLQMLARDGL